MISRWNTEIYYASESNEPYEDYEDLIETEFSELEVSEEI